MLKTKNVILKWNKTYNTWYKDKFYIFTKWGDEFEVKVEDLPDGSHERVSIECDGCGKLLENVDWQNYKKYVKEDGRYYCQKCANNGYKKYVSFYEWCYDNLPKEEADWIIARWDDELNIDKDGNKLTPKDVTYSSHGLNQKGYWFKCLDHPEHKSEQKSINSFTSGSRGSITCNQCNTITVTHPHLVKYFVNKEDALKSYGSNKKVPMRCPDCGYEKTIAVSTLILVGFGCHRCGDGIPYTEKFIFSIFEQLNKKFISQLTKTIFDWCKKYRYDFYIDDINGIICECHGLQHYEENINWKSTLQDVQENDKEKEILAKENNIKNYIILDCRYSNMEWIKNSVMNSELPLLLNFKESHIDWLKCEEFGSSNFLKIVCNLWNDGIKNTTEIAEILKVSRGTIIRYLKQGVKLGWCDYNSEEQSKNNLILMTQKILRKIICLTTDEVFNSITEASIKYKVTVSNISRCCRHKRKHAGKLNNEIKLAWMYYDEYLLI